MTPIKVPLDSKLRLLSYADGSGAPRLGIARTDGHVVDVAHAAGEAKIELGFDGTSMLALIEAGPQGLAKMRELAAAGTSAALKLQDIKLLPPLPKLTRNITCVGWNYVEHFEESQRFRASTQANAGASGVLYQGHEYAQRPLRSDPLRCLDLGGNRLGGRACGDYRQARAEYQRGGSAPATSSATPL